MSTIALHPGRSLTALILIGAAVGAAWALTRDYPKEIGRLTT